MKIENRSIIEIEGHDNPYETPLITSETSFTSPMFNAAAIIQREKSHAKYTKKMENSTIAKGEMFAVEYIETHLKNQKYATILEIGQIIFELKQLSFRYHGKYAIGINNIILNLKNNIFEQVMKVATLHTEWLKEELNDKNELENYEKE